MYDENAETIKTNRNSDRITLKYEENELCKYISIPGETNEYIAVLRLDRIRLFGNNYQGFD